MNDRYRIISVLGRGGMGEVYRADDLALGQSVALKFLPLQLVHNEEALRRFRNEVRVARQVSHPNVCRVHDVGEADSQIFLSMEYVDGEDLASLLRRIGRLPEDKALEISRKLCAGLAAAHEKGVLHRDLKPGNIMLDGRGQVLLTDFGLAGVAEEIHGSDVRSGTPAYMSPEQLAGKEVTVRSDIYALGLVLYELFTGRRPFEGASLADLMRAQQQNTPASISSLVRDLDPAVERVITRCLDPEPARRPASALLVSAGLPGGDPLAAALAAGETPSPQMVAAAGEGTGLSLRVALPLFAFVVVGIIAHIVLTTRSSALDIVSPQMSPEVAQHQARTILKQLGYGQNELDRAGSFQWEASYIQFAEQQQKKESRDWRKIFTSRPPSLRYWYRSSPGPLTAAQFHDDLLTPGQVQTYDPEPTYPGMARVDIDSEGRLLEFHAVPPQYTEKPEPASVPDWTPFFTAAEIDPASLRSTEPRWTWPEASDVRVGWEGVWPGTSTPLRIEAAALAGKPVYFVLMGPWTQPDKPPYTGLNKDDYLGLAISLIAIVVLAGSTVLARKNLLKGKGDRRGAFRLAAFVAVIHLALTFSRAHFPLSVGAIGIFFLALCTAIFYAVVLWTVYLALEPWVRRNWPQTIISWTRVLSGRIRDPIVGRDILIGAALSVYWRFLSHTHDLLFPGSARPHTMSVELLNGFRSSLGEYLENVPSGLRTTLFCLFLIVLFKVLLRKEVLAALAFVLVFAGLATIQGSSPALAVNTCLIYLAMAVVLMRFGLLALAAAIVIDGTIGDAPLTANPSAWYFPTAAACVLFTIGLAAWAFRESMGTKRLLQNDLFD